MKINVGVDIEDISRFRSKVFSDNEPFYRKIFTDAEIAYCLSQAEPSQHFAVRFCAKEAFMKAMHDKLQYIDIEVVFAGDKPTIQYPGVTVSLSLAHEKDKAIAFVVVS